MTRSIARTALLLLPMQIVFRAGEALLPLLIALWFGRSGDTDAYFLAAAFFTFVGSLPTGAFQDSALVPIIAELREKQPAEVPRVAGSLLAHALVVGAALGVAAGGVALAWAALHHDDALFAAILRMAVPFAFWVVAIGVRAFFAGLLNGSGWYFAQPIATGAGMAASLALIATLHTTLGIAAVPIGALLAELVAIAILAYVATARAKLALVLSLARPEPVRRFFALMGAAVAGATITRINPIIDQLMARIAGVSGGGTLLRLAADVASVPTSLAQAALFSVLLTRLSTDAAAARYDDFQRTLRRALVGTCALLCVAALVLSLVRTPLIRLVFLHGQMDERGVEQLAEIMPYALAGVAPFGAVLILALAHVALQNNRVMIALGVLNATLNLALDAALVGPLGLRGIALATSGMHLVLAIVFWLLLGQRVRALRVCVRDRGGP